MARLTADFIMSLDGYGAAEGWPGFWGMEGPEYLAWLEKDSSQDRIYLMGATTYRLMEQFAGQADDPGSRALNAARKLVFSSTLQAPLSWSNSEPIATGVIEAVKHLKATESLPLSTLGSLSLTRSLVAAGLVDRLRVVVFPVVTGATGREPIFHGYPDLALDIVESRTFDQGIQLLEYIPTVLEGPPSST